MTLDEPTIGRFIAAAGYDPATPVVVGVGSPATTLLAVRGSGVDGDSVGYAGSLAKQVTGACAALLAQEGVLDVETPISEWLPELPAWAAAIRVRHLVHHTAGLPATDAIWTRMEEAGEHDWTSDGAIRALSELEPDDPPGTVYAYSNAGYILLARAVEQASGRGLADVASERLFVPLGMCSSMLWSGPGPSPPVAALSRPTEPPLPLSLGDGGLWTTVGDLLRWNEALLADTLGVGELVHTTGALDDGTPLDYAWGVRVSEVGGRRIESHGGSWEGAAAKLLRLPELGTSFAAVARDGSVERMSALSAAVQDALLAGAAGHGR